MAAAAISLLLPLWRIRLYTLRPEIYIIYIIYNMRMERGENKKVVPFCSQELSPQVPTVTA